MNKNFLEIREFDREGFKVLVDFGTWRVAMLRYLDSLQPDRIDMVERHTATDEVFVLLHGRGMLIIGGNGTRVNKIYFQVMDYGKVYNVKTNTWHTTLLSQDASVLVVENSDTGSHNSEYANLTKGQRRSILEKVRCEVPEIM